MTEQGLKMIDRCPPKIGEQKIGAPELCELESFGADTHEPLHA